MPQADQLTIKQTPTGYWTVQRGATQLAGAATRKGAESERELLRRIGNRDQRPHEHREPVRAG
ncbi:MAG TPA: hypothetical protein VMI13_05290 [Solirubrobacteraceae bacterium]|nr:hypothetical protein [Solirubrobacteraceae bacterium]